MQRSKLDHPAFIALLGAAGLLLAATGKSPKRLGGKATHRESAKHPDEYEDGRGRNATTPTQMPARGWWDIAKRVFHKISENRLMAEAAGVTFYALLSIFPALAAMVSLYGLVADPATIANQVSSLSGVLPGGGIDIIAGQAKALASKPSGGLSIGLIIGLGTSLWSSNQGMKSLFDALNVVNGEHEKRGFFKLTAITLLFTLGVILFMVLALVAVVALPAFLNVVGLGGITDFLLRWLRWPLLLVALGGLLALIYRYGPSRRHAQWRWLSWGSGFAAVLWVVVSLLFSWYVASFGSYDKTYGSLGAVVGFMTWIWISTTVVLIGAQLDAEMETQTARDTTTGMERPRGQRGAAPADHLSRA